MTPRERLRSILHRSGPSDAGPAALCPGGMMSMAVTEVMAAHGVAWPRAHAEPEAMLQLALAMQQETGFDNLALPFCMTVEAEAYGAEINLGNATTQPRVRRPILAAEGGTMLPAPRFHASRAAALLSAIERARSLRPNLAIVGNLVGPFSLLGMLADPLALLRWTRRKPALVQDYMDRLCDDLAAFGRLQVQAGADVLCIAEPTATGEILGGRLFDAFARPWLQCLLAALRPLEVGLILHICGDVSAIEEELLDFAADAISFDSMVNIAALQRRRPPWRAMGNVDCLLLHSGPPEEIARRCRELCAAGILLVAPACGVIPTTPLAHLRAMEQAVAAERHKSSPASPFASASAAG